MIFEASGVGVQVSGFRHMVFVQVLSGCVLLSYMGISQNSVVSIFMQPSSLVPILDGCFLDPRPHCLEQLCTKESLHHLIYFIG